KDYIDMSVPVTLYPRMDNFPSQLFLRVPLKIKIDKLNVHNMNVVSEEYNPTTKRSSNIYFDKVHGTLKNLTNLSAAIKKNKNVSFSGSCLFMHQIPCKCSFQFNLSKYQTGDFSVDLHMAALDKTVLNPFTEPLSLFTVKSGTMQEATVHLEGNNFTTRCKLLMLYNDLHITPLKPDDNDSRKLKKKSALSFFANKFFIKDANPSHGNAPRYAEVFVQRAHNGFFNFVWKTILTSILKTVGIPLKYANK
ncbi:MAG TPA: hypothetical protein VN958_12465, partial [Chitinophagaceae bacterium]|nr:hypothetical protein [Chitinophagaceae bacterium]